MVFKEFMVVLSFKEFMFKEFMVVISKSSIKENQGERTLEVAGSFNMAVVSTLK